MGYLYCLIFFRRYFDDILDGIVFAGVIALGFATVENVLYYGQALGDGRSGRHYGDLFVMRGILSPFAHVTFTSMTGIGCGIARESHNKFVRISHAGPRIFLAAVTFTPFGTEWRLSAVSSLSCVGYLILEDTVLSHLRRIRVLYYAPAEQNLKEMLAIDVARGLIPKEHGEKAMSAFKSSGWLLGGIVQRQVPGKEPVSQGDRKTRPELLAHSAGDCGSGANGKLPAEPDLREEVLKWRDKV